MKKLLTIIVAVSLFLGSCYSDKYEKYFVTQKYYKAAGMCHDENREVKVHTIAYVHVPVHAAKHRHKMEGPERRVTISNSDGIEHLNLNLVDFNSLQIGDIVSYNKKKSAYKIFRKYKL